MDLLFQNCESKSELCVQTCVGKILAATCVWDMETLRPQIPYRHEKWVPSVQTQAISFLNLHENTCCERYAFMYD